MAEIKDGRIMYDRGISKDGKMLISSVIVPKNKAEFEALPESVRNELLEKFPKQFEFYKPSRIHNLLRDRVGTGLLALGGLCVLVAVFMTGNISFLIFYVAAFVAGYLISRNS